jgi:hypothetical protein
MNASHALANAGLLASERGKGAGLVTTAPTAIDVVTALRDGAVHEIAIEQMVPGGIVLLNAGDVVRNHRYLRARSVRETFAQGQNAGERRDIGWNPNLATSDAMKVGAVHDIKGVSVRAHGAHLAMQLSV